MIAASGCDARAIHSGIAVTNAAVAADQATANAVLTVVVIAASGCDTGAIHSGIAVTNAAVAAN